VSVCVCVSVCESVSVCVCVSQCITCLSSLIIFGFRINPEIIENN